MVKIRNENDKETNDHNNDTNQNQENKWINTSECSPKKTECEVTSALKSQTKFDMFADDEKQKDQDCLSDNTSSDYTTSVALVIRVDILAIPPFATIQIQPRVLLFLEFMIHFFWTKAPSQMN